MNTLLLPSFLSKAFSWIHGKGYAQGVFWAVMVCLVSSLNDVFIRFSSARLDFYQVAFFRFFFSILVLLPFMLKAGRSSFMTQNPWTHSLRAVLGYGAIVCWVAGIGYSQLFLASIMAQTVGLFVLVMAYFVLKEKVGWQRTVATFTGLLGILVILLSPKPGQEALSLENAFSMQNIGIWYLLAAAVMFAASDILNKIMVAKEPPLTMLFYFALGTSIIGLIPALMVWRTPEMLELLWMLCLGAGSTSILYCLLKAFAATDISALQPYRYVEIFFATGFGYLLFNEVPTFTFILGAAIIIPSTFCIAIYETKQQKKK